MGRAAATIESASLPRLTVIKTVSKAVPKKEPWHWEHEELLAPPNLKFDAVMARHGLQPVSTEDFKKHFGDLPTDHEG